MQEIALCSFISVLKLVIVTVLGILLGRKGILNKDARQSLSKIMMTTLLPALLISSLGPNASWDNLSQWPVLPLAAAIFIFMGFLFSTLCCRLLRLPASLHRTFQTATAFGNSTYLPLPLLMTITATAPIFLHDPDAGNRSFAYVSAYLMLHSPLLWLVGYTYLSGKSWREIKLSQLFSPPILGSLAGIAIGTIPTLNSLLIGKGAPLGFLMDVCGMLGKAIFPCALLLLGSNLADRLPEGESLPPRAYAGLTLCRLVLMPACGFGITYLCFRLNWIPKDPVFLLTLMLESAVPPATNLIVMTQVQKQGVVPMSRFLLCEYCMAIPLLTLNISFFLYIIQRLCN